MAAQIISERNQAREVGLLRSIVTKLFVGISIRYRHQRTVIAEGKYEEEKTLIILSIVIITRHETSFP